MRYDKFEHNSQHFSDRLFHRVWNLQYESYCEGWIEVAGALRLKTPCSALDLNFSLETVLIQLRQANRLSLEGYRDDSLRMEVDRLFGGSFDFWVSQVVQKFDVPEGQFNPK